MADQSGNRGRKLGLLALAALLLVAGLYAGGRYYQAEQERLELERLEAERLEEERLEEERRAAEARRLEEEQAELERLEAERLAAEESARGLSWVRIPGRDYSMTRSEITTAQYRVCVDAEVCWAPKNCELLYKVSSWHRPGREEHPINCVTWYQAKAYAEWAGGRLPTEAEWTHAAKGGESYWYAGSDSPGKVAWHKGNSGNRPHKVCGKEPNGYGLCDMSGNVWEWVSSGGGAYRVSRGGCYGSTVGVSARQGGLPPTETLTCRGFRIVRKEP